MIFHSVSYVGEGNEFWVYSGLNCSKKYINFKGRFKPWTQYYSYNFYTKIPIFYIIFKCTGTDILLFRLGLETPKSYSKYFLGCSLEPFDFLIDTIIGDLLVDWYKYIRLNFIHQHILRYSLQIITFKDL